MKTELRLGDSTGVLLFNLDTINGQLSHRRACHADDAYLALLKIRELALPESDLLESINRILDDLYIDMDDLP